MGRQKINDNLDTFLNYLDELFPNAHCELNYNDAFTLLIAVVLSAQTTDKAVNIVTKELFKKFCTPKALSNAKISDVEQLIKRLGLYKVKSKNIIEIAKKLVLDYNCEVPSSMQELTKLPGVGRKTASVVLIEYFKTPAFPVDTHINRVSKRIELAKENDNVVTIENILKKLFKDSIWAKLHHQIIFFGRYQCTAKNPKCTNCKLKNYCKLGYNLSITDK